MRVILFLMLLVSCIQTRGQVITGKVIDASTVEPLPYVSVVGPDNSVLAITDHGGVFKIESGLSGDSLKLVFMGYKTKVVHKEASLIRLSPSRAELDQVIVTAGRDEQIRSEAPIAITSISKNVLNETKAASLEMVLNKVSGVYMVDLGNEQHSMAIRQPISTKSLFLYMEDGIPIRTTGDFNHNALIEINAAALKGIEVVRGPVSSLYGSEAIGGAVNFITQAPSGIDQAKIQTEISSLGCSRSEFSISGTRKKLGIYAGGYYTNQNHTYRDHSDFTKTAFTLRGDLNLSDKTKLITSASYIDYKTDQTGGLDSLHFYGKDYVSFHSFTYRKVKALRMRSTLDHTFNSRSSVFLTAYMRANEIGQNPFYAIRTTRNPLLSRGEINSDSFRSYGAIGQYRHNFSRFNAKLIAGASFDYSPATYKADYILINKTLEGYFTDYSRTDSVLTHYQADLVNTAGYVQGELSPVKRLRIVAALRYDHLVYKFDNFLTSSAFTGAPDNTNYFTKVTPKAGMTYRLFKNASAYFNYSLGFAPPQITELYRGVKVPTLIPATFHNYESGVWFSFNREKGYADVSIYQLSGQNEIVSVRLADGSYENQNTGMTLHKGIEYSVRYSFLESLQLRVSGSNALHSYVEYIERGVDFSGNRMSAAPSFICNSELTYRPKFIPGFRISGEVQIISPYFMDAANTEKYDGYSIFNLRTGYRFSSFELWVNMLNITDEVYATVAEKSAFGKSYRPGNLRAIYLGASYTLTGKK